MALFDSLDLGSRFKINRAGLTEVNWDPKDYRPKLNVTSVEKFSKYHDRFFARKVESPEELDTYIKLLKLPVKLSL
jgi:hypothetical protein